MEIVITKDTHTDNQYNASGSNSNSYNANNNYSAAYKEFSDTENDCIVNDIVAKSSEIHWSELKAKGLLKTDKNPTAIALNTSKSKEVDDFLSRYGSKKCKSKAA